MARFPTTTRRASGGKQQAPPSARVRFSLINGVLLAAGLACVVLGFVLLSNGSTVAAPLLLVLGYGVLTPWGIMHQRRARHGSKKLDEGA